MSNLFDIPSTFLSNKFESPNPLSSQNLLAFSLSTSLETPYSECQIYLTYPLPFFQINLKVQARYAFSKPSRFFTLHFS